MSIQIQPLESHEYPKALHLLSQEKKYAYLPDAFTPLWTVTPDGLPKALWKIESQGEWVGTAGYVLVETDRALAHIGLIVDPKRRRQGIGDQVLQHLLDALQKRNVKQVLSGGYDQQADGLRFLSRHGFCANGSSLHSALDVATTTLAGHLDPDDLVAEQTLHFATLNHFPRRGLAERLLPIWNRTRPDQPQDWPYKEYSARRFEEEMLEPQEMALQHSYAILTAEQKVVALNMNVCIGESLDQDRIVDSTQDNADSSRLLTVYTAVDPAYRGRKLATALKLKLINHAQHHGIQGLAAENDERNVVMWHINQRLGYHSVANFARYQKILASLP